jgi:hypothetical protein
MEVPCPCITGCYLGEGAIFSRTSSPMIFYAPAFPEEFTAKDTKKDLRKERKVL